jgi:ABC-type lipoprotein release transport system permease subunit
MLRPMLAWHLGLRYLRKRRAAWLALAAITLTVAVPVLVLGVMQGFVDVTRRQVRANEPDLTAEAHWRSGPLIDRPARRRALAELPGVAAIAPFVSTYAILAPRLNGADAPINVPCLVDAIDWTLDGALGRLADPTLHAAPVTDLKSPPIPPGRRGSGMITPAWRDHLALLGMELMAPLGLGPLPLPPRQRPLPGLVVGRELAYNHGLRPGLAVQLALPNASGGLTGQVTAEISDTIGTGIYEVDRMVVLLPLPLGQRLTDLHARGEREARLSGWRIALSAGADAERVRSALADLTGLRVSTWAERRGNLVKSMEIQRNVIGLVMIAIQIIAVFIVYAVFSTLVAEKRHDIGVLLGIGARRGAIAGAFLVAGLAACVIGGVLGWVLGWGGLAALDPLSRHFGLTLFPQDVMYTPDTPVSWNPVIPLIFIGIMSVVGLLAVLLPAWRASRIDPVAILREGN